MTLRDDPHLSRARDTATSRVHVPVKAALQCGLVRGQEVSPHRARCCPSADSVGVLAGARPADGPNGCSPSAPSWRRSAGRSSLLRRRIRCLPTPLARLALPPRSPPTGCSLCMAGDHWTLRWKLFFMAAKRQRAAVAWRRAGARAVRRAHASVCTEAREGPRSRSGRRLVVEPADPRCLAGPPGPITELGGLWSPWVSSRVRV